MAQELQTILYRSNLTPQRDVNASYRIHKQGKYYEVKTFPQIPEPINTVVCRLDHMPAWMQDIVRMLDALSRGETISLPMNGAAWLAGDVYWIQHGNAIDEVQPEPTHDCKT
jgi:hypothetical protein